MAETPPTIVKTNLTGPAMEAAAQLLALLQADLPEGAPADHLLGSAYLCIRNAFAQHVGKAPPDVYLNACVAIGATEVFGQAERMTRLNCLPDSMQEVGIAMIGRQFMDRLMITLSAPPGTTILSNGTAPRREAG